MKSLLNLKKNYIYNFFRSSSRFNSFFLKNNFFLFKFYKVLNFFFFINFFLKKKITFNKFNISFIKYDQSLFINKKNDNLLNNLYGNNYLIFKNEVKNVYKFTNPQPFNLNPILIKYNYNNILNFNQFFNILVYINIK